MSIYTAAHRLVAYGTLAPGQVNAHQLDVLEGSWQSGVVRGVLIADGCGLNLDCPGLMPDPEGDEVAVMVFTSPDLPIHWVRLDTFEGAEYRRVEIRVQTAEGVLDASIYGIIPKA